MEKEVLREIESARKNAINEMLIDVGFMKKKEANEKSMLRKSFELAILPITIHKHIRHHNLKKEEEYYKKKIEEMLAQKTN